MQEFSQENGCSHSELIVAAGHNLDKTLQRDKWDVKVRTQLRTGLELKSLGPNVSADLQEPTGDEGRQNKGQVVVHQIRPNEANKDGERKSLT